MKIEKDKNELAEKCLTCGKDLKKGDGRFRTIERVYCVKCYYEFHPPPISIEEHGCITINTK